MPPQHTLISIVEIFYFLNFQSLLIFPVPLIHQPPIIVHVAILMRLLCPLCLSVSVHGKPTPQLYILIIDCILSPVSPTDFRPGPRPLGLSR